MYGRAVTNSGQQTYLFLTCESFIRPVSFYFNVLIRCLFVCFFLHILQFCKDFNNRDDHGVESEPCRQIHKCVAAELDSKPTCLIG